MVKNACPHFHVYNDVLFVCEKAYEPQIKGQDQKVNHEIVEEKSSKHNTSMKLNIDVTKANIIFHISSFFHV